jgi:hypothetical protein
MSKAFGFLGLVVTLWIVMEFYANGIEGAFGGALASDSGSNAVLRTERAADAFERAYDESTARVDRALED